MFVSQTKDEQLPLVKSFNNLTLLGIIVLAVGSTLAIIFSPTFNIKTSYISSLGNRKEITTVVSGTHIQATEYPEIFNGTLIVSSVLLLSPFLHQTIIFHKKLRGVSYVFLWGALFAWFLAMIAMAVVGIADTGTQNFYHVIALTEFFGMATFAITYRLIMILTSPFRRSFSKVDIINSLYLFLLGLTRAATPEIWTEKYGDYTFQRLFVIGFFILLILMYKTNRAIELQTTSQS